MYIILSKNGRGLLHVSEELGHSYKLILKILEELARDKEIVRVPKSNITRYHSKEYVMEKVEVL